MKFAITIHHGETIKARDTINATTFEDAEKYATSLHDTFFPEPKPGTRYHVVLVPQKAKHHLDPYVCILPNGHQDQSSLLEKGGTLVAVGHALSMEGFLRGLDEQLELRGSIEQQELYGQCPEIFSCGVDEYNSILAQYFNENVFVLN